MRVKLLRARIDARMAIHAAAAQASVPASTAWRLPSCKPSRLPPTGASAFAHAVAPEHTVHADGEQAACFLAGSVLLLPKIARVRAESSGRDS